MTTPTGNALTDANASAAAAATTAAAASTSAPPPKSAPPPNDCIWPGGTRDIGLGLRAPCAFSYGEARAVLAVGIILAGLGVTGVGVAMFSVIAVLPGAEKVGGTVAEGVGAAATVAGAPEVGIPLAAGGAEVKKHGTAKTVNRRAQSNQRKQRQQDRHDERQYDEVAARRRDSSRGPALRDRESVPY